MNKNLTQMLNQKQRTPDKRGIDLLAQAKSLRSGRTCSVTR
ncbi:hypothetical protein [Spirosoma daeguense]